MLFSNIYYAFRMTERIGSWINNNKDSEFFQKFAEGVKNFTSNAIANYADTLDQSTWDNMVDKYETTVENMSEEERAQSAELANAYLNVIDSSENVSFENMEASIRENPELWGQYLENSGVTPESVQEMQARIDAGEDITNRDVYDVAISGAATSLTETVTQPSTTVEQTIEGTAPGPAVGDAMQATTEQPETGSTTPSSTSEGVQSSTTVEGNPAPVAEDSMQNSSNANKVAAVNNAFGEIAASATHQADTSLQAE